MIEHVTETVAAELQSEAQPPAVGWASGPLGAVQAAEREIARQTAARARAVAEFTASRQASVDRQPGRPGAMSAERRAARPEVLAEVSEWAAQELVVALSISLTAAEQLLARSLTLVHRLPRTLAALEAGVLHVGHLWPLLEKVAPIAEAKVRRQVEGDLLAWVARRSVTTPAQLGAEARRLVLARDARGAAQRLTAALRRRGTMWLRPGESDGMAVLSVLLTLPEARVLLDALGRYADAVGDESGEPVRTRGQKMADCLLDLVLRPGETELPPVQAQVTVVAPVTSMAGGDQSGEVDGEPVPADVVGALARAFGLLPEENSTPPAGDPPPDRVDVGQPADDRWDEVKDRLLVEPWGGAEAPPAEELERYWAQQLAWEAAETGDGPSEPALEDAEPESAGWWGAADAAISAASEVSWRADAALRRARGAVERAEIAEATDEETWQQSAGCRLGATVDAVSALARLSAERRAELAALLERTGGGGLVDRPRIAVTDALTGALLALTDARGLRACAVAGRGLGPPGPSSTYRPAAMLDRFVRARDRRCRFPGCRRRVPRGGELDHNVPWPDGATSAENLEGFCTPDHRGKHQAPGWEYDLAPDGRLTVTTPTGLVATTTPPPF
jgi:hypothetical protein